MYIEETRCKVGGESVKVCEDVLRKHDKMFPQQLGKRGLQGFSRLGFRV